MSKFSKYVAHKPTLSNQVSGEWGGISTLYERLGHDACGEVHKENEV